MLVNTSHPRSRMGRTTIKAANEMADLWDLKQTQ